MTTHVMIDLETLSTRNDAAVLSIGAVKFDLKEVHVPDLRQLLSPTSVLDNYLLSEGSICTPGAFYFLIDDTSGHMELGTVLWWLQQPEEARLSQVDKVRKKGALLQAYLTNLLQWVDDCPVWGNGASFDNTILRSFFHRNEVRCWNNRQDRCYRTWKQGRPALDESLKAEGVKHHALADAYNQARHMVSQGGF